MNRKLVLISAVLVLAGNAFQTANAALDLTFSPESQSVSVGDAVTVDAVLTGLHSAGEILSAFDVSVDFNSSVVGLTSLVLGTTFGNLSTPVTTSLLGSTISWNLTSAELDATLLNLQGDSVILGKLAFTALNPGKSPLTYSYSDLTGLNAQALSYSSVVGNITVTGTGPGPVVSEPASVTLLAAGILGFVASRRKATQG